VSEITSPLATHGESLIAQLHLALVLPELPGLPGPAARDALDITLLQLELASVLLQDFSEHLQVEDAGLVAQMLRRPSMYFIMASRLLLLPFLARCLPRVSIIWSCWRWYCCSVLVTASSATDTNRGSAAMLAFPGSVALDPNALTRTSQLKSMSMS